MGDGDGTTLMDKSCGGGTWPIAIGGESIGSSLPPAIVSRTNTINLVFKTNDWYTETGWSVSWRAVTGVITSPNYPGNYSNNLEKNETIQVEEGLIISLQFDDFQIQRCSDCSCDHLTITDGDGTTLMEKSCGFSLPPAITSNTNTINLVFITDDDWTYPGWSVSWRAWQSEWIPERSNRS